MNNDKKRPSAAPRRTPAPVISSAHKPSPPPPAMAAGIPAVTRGQDTPPSLERVRRIAERAYYLAEEQGFQPGHELEHWLKAEAEVGLMESKPAR